jgi:uncharacterized protein YoxC
MNLSDANAWFDLVLAVAAVVAVLLGVFRWANRAFEKRIVEEIREATYQIQPQANGGKSLSDLHEKFDRLADDVLLLKRAVVQIEDDIEDMR